MTVILNGRTRELQGVQTVEELIQALSIHRMIVVQRNGAIVPRGEYAEAPVCEGDVLEIVHFVGGG